MRDLAFVAFLLALVGMGLRRPFLFVLGYAYVDIVAPQRLSYLLLNSVPLSLIMAAFALGGWMVAEEKRGIRIAPRQILLGLLLLYCAITTSQADFPLEALQKWSWVWKALAFAIFLPFTLRTRLRIEGLVLFMTLSAASIIIVGGIKTLASGGGYGELNLMVTNNSGLYESSIIATVAICVVPLVLWLARFGTIFPRGRPTWSFAAALIFACLLIPVGTQARTGIICVGVLALLQLRNTRRRLLYVALVGAAALVTIPLLPAGFTQRADTIKRYQADTSASTRLAVWTWTLGYVRDHPFGGGFEAYRQNNIRIETKTTTEAGGQTDVTQGVQYDQSRAYHSAYFEMLGEQGWPGLTLWLLLHGIGLIRMERLRRRFREGSHDWIAGLATALQEAHIVYLVGSLFVGIAFQPFVYMLIGLQIGLDGHAARLLRIVPAPMTHGNTAGAAAV